MRKRLSISKFEELYSNFKSHPTWTKQKYRDKELLFQYLDSHEHVTIQMQHKNFPFRAIWSYDIYEVPMNQLGKLYIYRGMKVLRLSIIYTLYAKDTMICLPLDKE